MEEKAKVRGKRTQDRITRFLALGEFFWLLHTQTFLSRVNLYGHSKFPGLYWCQSPIHIARRESVVNWLRYGAASKAVAVFFFGSSSFFYTNSHHTSQNPPLTASFSSVFTTPIRTIIIRTKPFWAFFSPRLHLLENFWTVAQQGKTQIRN